jgi:hypothetical protein
MEHFAFCHSVHPEVHALVRGAGALCWPSSTVLSARDFTLITPIETSGSAITGDHLIGMVSGYVRHDTLSHQKNEQQPSQELYQEFFRLICDRKGWPLNSEWTGSFSAVAFSQTMQTLALCNDLLGYIPLYYSTTGRCIVGASSLIFLACVLQPQADPVGVLQRITPLTQTSADALCSAPCSACFLVSDACTQLRNFVVPAISITPSVRGLSTMIFHPWLVMSGIVSKLKYPSQSVRKVAFALPSRVDGIADLY